MPSTLVGGCSSSGVDADQERPLDGGRRAPGGDGRVPRQQAEPDEIPALQVNNIDFSYGHVQVLFDVAFEVRKGEVLALLGTNGAGKSTILRVIAGLGTPARGVVRLNGLTITYVSPEKRGAWASDCFPEARACSRR